VQAVGGYGDFALMEDYLLWAKMILAGARVANVADPLVAYRVGAGAYRRRGGWAQLRTELGLQRRLRAMGFTTRAQCLRNVVVRGGYRVVPEGVRRFAYRRLIASYGARCNGAPAALEPESGAVTAEAPTCNDDGLPGN
jgi:hypothetical protein